MLVTWSNSANVDFGPSTFVTRCCLGPWACRRFRNPSGFLKDVGAIVVAPLVISGGNIGPLPFVTSGRYFRCNGSSSIG